MEWTASIGIQKILVLVKMTDDRRIDEALDENLTRVLRSKNPTTTHSHWPLLFYWDLSCG
jgi:hypothetical protein